MKNHFYISHVKLCEIFTNRFLIAVIIYLSIICFLWNVSKGGNEKAGIELIVYLQDIYMSHALYSFSGIVLYQLIIPLSKFVILESSV